MTKRERIFSLSLTNYIVESFEFFMFNVTFALPLFMIVVTLCSKIITFKVHLVSEIIKDDDRGE